jgi:hypothetical protein
MAAFLNDPAQPLETACIAEMAPTHFTTDVHMNAGIYRLAKLLQGDSAPGRLAGLGLIALLLLSAVVIWPLAWLVRRIRQRQPATPASANRARWLAAFTALLGLGFLVGLGGIVLTTARENPFLLGFGVPGSAGPIFLLPWLVLLATIGVAIFAIAAFKQHWWNFAGRVHYLFIALACAGFVAWVFSLGLI